jgi:hypothetical protein
MYRRVMDIVGVVVLLHVVLYAALLRFGFRLTWLRASLVAMLREAVGAALYWALMTPYELDWSFATTLLVTAPLAWLLVAPLDPRRSLARLWRWVLAGSAVSIAVNYVLFGLLLGHEFFHSRSLQLIRG